MKKKVRPIHDRVVVLADTPEVETKSGIYISTLAQEKPQTGTVIAVGNGKGEPMTVKEGEKVMFAKFAGQDITIDDEHFLIMRESDILMIIETE